MTRLSIAEAVPLGAASVLRLASDHGVRALLVKGEALRLQGLRGAYESTDVDVLVDPADFDRYLTVLAALGWVGPPTSTAPSIMERHAVTVLHPAWPISVDVHRYFPGFLADKQEVFDILWQRRESVQIAGVPLPVPDRVAHAAVAALHLLRSPDSGKAAEQLPELQRLVDDSFDTEALADLADVAQRTGATQTLRPLLTSVGAPLLGVGAGDPQRLAQWRARTGATGSEAWVLHLLRQPPWRWPREIRHAVVLSDAEIEAFHQHPGESLPQARRRRLRRGVRSVAVAVPNVLRLRSRALLDRLRGRR